ncbi:MAG TPA: Xaa-Pro peptidase family protein [Acidimicrobiia bacterium]|nr:Xaa-Pro peptidase family protein [Acidimicrobiia bacterium]
MNHPNRVTRLAARLERALLVTSLVNIRYLTGFTGTSAYLVMRPDGGTLITDGRYIEMAQDLAAAIPGIDLKQHAANLMEVLVGAIGPDTEAFDVEADHVSWAFARRLQDAATGRVLPATGIVEALRKVKDSDEVDALRRAAAAGDHAFATLDGLLETAESEGDLGLGLIDSMRAAGGDAAGWPPIVAVGANAARPHHRSGAGDLAGAGLLLMDYGCVVDGYHSDMTRTVWIGDNTDPEMVEIHAAVLEANEAGIAAALPGAKAHDVDEACRAVLRAHGYEEFFVHSTGHGVGLEVHEAPWVKKDSEDVLEAGHVVTIEPGVYLPGKGGVRIEDMVLVTEDGNDVLTRSTKEMRPA